MMWPRLSKEFSEVAHSELVDECLGDLASTKALDLPSAAIEEHRNLTEFPESLNEPVVQYA